MEIFLNISNPVYVSSSDVQDEIHVRVKEPLMFQSAETNVSVKMNFTTTLYLPSMTSAEDSSSIMQLGENTKNSMLFTLIVPFCFMVFMSFSMDRVWSMYLMLQIISNLINLRCLQRPGNVEYLLFMAQKISDFKVSEEENI